MKSLILALLICFSSMTFAAVGSPVRFPAEVKSFDKMWVNIVANNKNFKIRKQAFEASNGPVRSGKLVVQLDADDFYFMKEISRIKQTH